MAGVCYKKVREFSNKIYDNSIIFPSAIELSRNTNAGSIFHNLEKSGNQRQIRSPVNQRNPMNR